MEIIPNGKWKKVQLEMEMKIQLENEKLNPI